MPSSEIIDIHAHLYPEGCFAEVVKDDPEFKLIDAGRMLSLYYRGSHVMSLPKEQGDMAKRVASMDEARIGAAVLSVGALNIGWAGARAADAARSVNDGLAAFCRQASDRFRFAAVLPCADPAAMLRELDRALDLGAAAVGIATRYGEIQLHAPELRDFWHEMSRRRLTVLVHPTFPCDGPAGDAGSFIAVGYPGETALAATRLALAGVLEECPDMKVVWSHLGGGLAMIIDRIDRGYQRFSACPHPPSHYLKRCYFDTACTHGPALDCARATFGARALLFGTDVPHVPNTENETAAALQSRPWPAADLEAVFGANARAVLAR